MRRFNRHYRGDELVLGPSDCGIEKINMISIRTDAAQRLCYASPTEFRRITSYM